MGEDDFLDAQYEDRESMADEADWQADLWDSGHYDNVDDDDSV